MISENLTHLALQTGLDTGADFVELFIEETRNASLVYKDQKVEAASAGTEFGIGIRLLFGTSVIYGHISDVQEEKIIKLIQTLGLGQKKQFSPKQIAQQFQVQKWDRLASIVDPRLKGQKAKLPFLEYTDRKIRALSNDIHQVTVSASDSQSLIRIVNSEGLDISDERIRSRFNVMCVAGSGQERVSAHEAPGAMMGFEFFENLNLDELSNQVGERALRMLKAGYIDGGQMPVIMGNGFGGVIFHEACGHPLETEAIRRKASPFANKIGESIGQPCLTAIDDGTIAQSWGSLNIDDEGMPVQKTTLIENGVLKTYLSDRIGSQEVGVARSGSARRESYKYAPVSRMRNTYIAAGDSDFEEMISSVSEGLYAKKMGGGSVNPATGEFNFSVEEGFKIRNGKIAEPVRGATLIGKGHEVLPKISMVGNDLVMAAGMCGASSGSVPVTVGQPHLKVDNILVGGH